MLTVPRTQGTIRLSEVVSALSTALDLTEGQPMGHAIRNCIIGMRIAEELRLEPQQCCDLYYALLLKGFRVQHQCRAHAPDSWFG